MIMEGTSSEIGDMIDFDFKNISVYARRNCLVKGIYRVKKTGKYYHKKNYVEKKKKEKKRTEFDDILDNILIYGNTISSKKPTNIIRRLKRRGLNVGYHKSTQGNYYILEKKE